MKHVHCCAFVGTITSSPSVFLMKVRDMSSWKPGVYVVQITMGSETYSTKISVK